MSSRSASDIVLADVIAAYREAAAALDAGRDRFPDVLDFGEGARPRRVRWVHLGDRRGRIEYLAMHPAAIVAFEAAMRRAGCVRSPGDPWDAFMGIPLHESKHMPIYARKWEFPPHPWVEYGADDERWARPIGYGREVEDFDTLVGVAWHRMGPGVRVAAWPPRPGFWRAPF